MYTIVTTNGNPARNVTPVPCPVGQFYYTSPSWFSGCMHCPAVLPTNVVFPIECRGHTHSSTALPSLPATNKYGERICGRFEPVINCAPQPHPDQDQYGEQPLFPTGRPPYDIYDYGIPRPLPECSKYDPVGTACTPTSGLSLESLIRSFVSFATTPPVIKAVLCLSTSVPIPILQWVVGGICVGEDLRVAMLYDNRQVFTDPDNTAAYLRWIEKRREQLDEQLRQLDQEEKRILSTTTTTTLPLCPTEFPASGCTTASRSSGQQTAPTNQPSVSANTVPIAPLVSLPAISTMQESLPWYRELTPSEINCQTAESLPQFHGRLGVCLALPITTTTTSTLPPLPPQETKLPRQPESQSDCPAGTYIQGMDYHSWCKPCTSNTWDIPACKNQAEFTITVSPLAETQTSDTSTTTTITEPIGTAPTTTLSTP